MEGCGGRGTVFVKQNMLDIMFISLVDIVVIFPISLFQKQYKSNKR